MGVLTLLKFLVGDREAILRIAGDRHALWIGFVFVLSAGFAREYDGEDLLAEPWHLLIPLGASLAAATLLYLLIHVVSQWRGTWRWPSFSAYLSFLGLFWMTAPLAWLYAIPYERFLRPQGAVDMNLTTLALVAAWRVALMIRVTAVCTDLSPWGSAGVVMLFASAVLTVAGFLAGVRLAIMMGGVRGGEDGPDWRPELLYGLGCLAFPSLLVWLILAVRNRGRDGWLAPLLATPSPPTWALTALATVSLLVWVPILPFTQAEQRLRRAFEHAIYAEDYARAARILTDNPRDAFPPGWAPPLKTLYLLDFRLRELLAECLNTLQSLHESGGPEWAKERYLKRIKLMLEQRHLDQLSHAMLADGLLRFPEGAALLAEAREGGRPPEPGPDEPFEKRWAHQQALSRYKNLRAVLDILDGKKPN